PYCLRCAGRAPACQRCRPSIGPCRHPPCRPPPLPFPWRLRAAVARPWSSSRSLCPRPPTTSVTRARSSGGRHWTPSAFEPRSSSSPSPSPSPGSRSQSWGSFSNSGCPGSAVRYSGPVQPSC
ncbi:hypothetical protein H4R19_006564, partial [Coemansia spiralis]